MLPDLPALAASPEPALPLELVRAARPGVTDGLAGRLHSLLSGPVPEPNARERLLDLRAARKESPPSTNGKHGPGANRLAGALNGRPSTNGKNGSRP